MLIGPQSYEHTFRDIQQSLQSSDEKNVIICASTAECDSVCGVRILQVSCMYEARRFARRYPTYLNAQRFSFACRSTMSCVTLYAALVDEQWHPLLDIPG